MSTNKPYSLAVVIGRFQPFHLGHLALVEKAFSQADNVLVIVGSSYQPRSPKNPLTYPERVQLIYDSVEDHFAPIGKSVDGFLHFKPARDFLYEDNKWVSQIQTAISDVVYELRLEEKVVIVGHDKDDSTFYLKWFPGYANVDAGKFVEMNELPIDATQIRELIYGRQFRFISGAMPNKSYEWLMENFINTKNLDVVIEENDFIQEYKSKWKDAPFPVTLNTVDAVVLQGGHILLIQRRAAPGKGLWALPGGYIGVKETQKQSMLRELFEETRLKVPKKILEANITHSDVFDHPDRSQRGRVITRAFLIELPGPEDGALPKVKGADDAMEAKWFPISTALNMPEQLFEDHHSIISMMTARAK